MAACDICEIAEYCNEGKFPDILEPLAACEYETGTEYRETLSIIRGVFDHRRK